MRDGVNKRELVIPGSAWQAQGGCEAVEWQTVGRVNCGGSRGSSEPEALKSTSWISTSTKSS